MSRDTAERLLYQLKSRGPQPVASLAAACAITPMGAAKQLQLLQTQGLVELLAPQRADSQAGRPARLWQLTAAGHGRFPDRHGDLSVQLLGHLRELYGEAGLERLIARREQQMAEAYRARLQGARSLPERLRRLAALRAEEGYLARIEPEPGSPRRWLLIEDHCPICAAAESCAGFCRSELALFRQLLGPELQVERCEHLLAGARRCVYRIAAI